MALSKLPRANVKRQEVPEVHTSESSSETHVSPKGRLSTLRVTEEHCEQPGRNSGFVPLNFTSGIPSPAIRDSTEVGLFQLREVTDCLKHGSVEQSRF